MLACKNIGGLFVVHNQLLCLYIRKVGSKLLKHLFSIPSVLLFAGRQAAITILSKWENKDTRRGEKDGCAKKMKAAFSSFLMPCWPDACARLRTLCWCSGVSRSINILHALLHSSTSNVRVRGQATDLQRSRTRPALCMDYGQLVCCVVLYCT